MSPAGTDQLAVRAAQGNSKAREELLQRLSDFIYHYSAIAFSEKDPDFQSEFYLKVLEKFDSIIKNYEGGTVGFRTYLSAVLKNLYIDQKKDLRTFEVSLDDEGTAGDPALVTSDENDAPVLNGLSPHSFFDIEKKTLHYLVVKLYYFEFFTEEDFVLLQQESGRTWGECVKLLDDIMEWLHKRKLRRLRFEHLLTRLREMILKSQQELSDLMQYKGDSARAEDIRRRETALRERQADYLKRYNSVKVFPPQILLADFFKRKNTDITNIINNFKTKIIRREEEYA